MNKVVIFRVGFLALVFLYYLSLYLSIGTDKPPLSRVGDAGVFIFAILALPFLFSFGFFLFRKYPNSTVSDLLHYAVIYPIFALFVMQMLLLMIGAHD